jgi:DNA-directed RNA polymerase I and III subunit RPAC1
MPCECLTLGKRVAKVHNARYDSCSRNSLRYDDLSQAVTLGRVKDHFICKQLYSPSFVILVSISGTKLLCPMWARYSYIFLLAVTIESVGAMSPDALFVESLKVLMGKCRKFLAEINKN